MQFIYTDVKLAKYFGNYHFMFNKWQYLDGVSFLHWNTQGIFMYGQ